ncbi:MAG: hypothetical protein WCY09_09410 [Candidatus Omnitrophota bacterium]
MTDDPRDILKEAGVEVPEVERWSGLRPVEDQLPKHSVGSVLLRQTKCIGGDAILALSRLVAKYRWQRDTVMADWESQEGPGWGDVAGLDRRWEEHNA